MKILVANRGEIAVRIMRTCREMGIPSVAVYSEADAGALHVLTADETVAIGPAEPARSYLDIDRILAAAKETGATAIHPGYGFLAENPTFAARCAEAGITFIGPPARVIEDLGNKVTARAIMTAAGIPVVPGGMASAEETPPPLAEGLDFPLLIKAAAGGGGKGMRIVERPEAFPHAWQSARREAAQAFGDPTLYVERFFARPRHIEVQILADTHGNTIHLFERECSIQRRHQKIVEETPAPNLSPALRDRILEAAVAVARASGYVNAGTVEFLVAETGEFYFLEVNTRLQVEHPITEATTGIDLVRQQIEIAQGKPLRYRQEHIGRRGHAIECRIYAEDPAEDFIPSPGRILAFAEPTGPGLRNDCGVRAGCEVPIHYDPILSKLIAFAEDRGCAIDRMIAALERYVVLGVRTPIPFLIDLLRLPTFREGKLHTGFIEAELPGWRQEDRDAEIALLACALDRSTRPRRETPAAEHRSLITPWDRLGRWRG
ncbi:MAG: acetyl-CoA carboxylase biotin carboxylase subunit [Deltaproteobacteria bacterium]|nr:MAG: acetyl-CoA carboxylase biotin carboxylase subunit [Deltaproteobacteria bacterium]